MLDAAKGLDYPTGIAFNSGNMYIVNDSVSYTKKLGFVTVIAKRSGAIFGQYIRANKATVLDVTKKVVFPIGIAFDSVGNMYMTSFNNSNASGVGFVTVIAKDSTGALGNDCYIVYPTWSQSVAAAVCNIHISRVKSNAT